MRRVAQSSDSILNSTSMVAAKRRAAPSGSTPRPKPASTMRHTPSKLRHLDAKAQGEIDGGGLGMHRARNRRRFEKPHEVVVQIIDEPRLRLARREDAMGGQQGQPIRPVGIGGQALRCRPLHDDAQIRTVSLHRRDDFRTPGFLDVNANVWRLGGECSQIGG